MSKSSTVLVGVAVLGGLALLAMGHTASAASTPAKPSGPFPPPTPLPPTPHGSAPGGSGLSQQDAYNAIQAGIAAKNAVLVAGGSPDAAALALSTANAAYLQAKMQGKSDADAARLASQAGDAAASKREQAEAYSAMQSGIAAKNFVLSVGGSQNAAALALSAANAAYLQAKSQGKTDAEANAIAAQAGANAATSV